MSPIRAVSRTPQPRLESGILSRFRGHAGASRLDRKLSRSWESISSKRASECEDSMVVLEKTVRMDLVLREKRLIQGLCEVIGWKSKEDQVPVLGLRESLLVSEVGGSKSITMFQFCIVYTQRFLCNENT